jgi:hypothetical protein
MGLTDPADPGEDGDGEDSSAGRVTAAGASADPVKDYLSQIGKVRLLTAGQEVDLAKRIEAGLFADQKLAGGSRDLSADARIELEQVAEDGRRAKVTWWRPTCAWSCRWPGGTPGTGCCSWT